MTATAYEGLQKILEPLLEYYPNQVDLARAWASGDKAAIKQVDELLASAGLTMDAVMAQTIRADCCERAGPSRRHSARN